MNYYTKTRGPSFTAKQIFKPEQKISRTLSVYTAFQNTTLSTTEEVSDSIFSENFQTIHANTDDTLDLNGYLISHPSETFLIKIAGDTQSSLAISAGDLLVVTQSTENRDGKLVVGMLDGKFVIKYLKVKGKQLFFAGELPGQADSEITSETKFELWGIVSYIIHKPSLPPTLNKLEKTKE